MKTIALHEKTFEMLEDLKKQKKIESFDKLVKIMILEENKIPNSMFGILKGKMKPFTTKERDELWKDKNRNI